MSATETMNARIQAMATNFTPPPAKVSQIVDWFPPGEYGEKARAVPAIVTGVGSRTLHVAVIAPNVRNLQHFDGVRHVSDPAARHGDFAEGGTWQHTADTVDLNLLRDMVKHLEETVNELLK